MPKIACKNARFTVGSNNVAATRMSVTMRAQLLDGTSTEGSGNAEWVAGVFEGEFNAECVYDPSVGQVGIMTPGTSYTVEFFPVAASSGSKVTGTAFVETHEMTGEARGLFTSRVSGKYTGAVTAASV